MKEAFNALEPAQQAVINTLMAVFAKDDPEGIKTVIKKLEAMLPVAEPKEEENYVDKSNNQTTEV